MERQNKKNKEHSDETATMIEKDAVAAKAKNLDKCIGNQSHENDLTNSSSTKKHYGFIVKKPLIEDQSVSYIHTPNNAAYDYSFSEPVEEKPVGYEYELEEDEFLDRLTKSYPIKIMGCGDVYVSEGIGARYELWQANRPVCISARTGRGKNEFIEKELLTYISRQNIKENTDNRIIILSNRIALNVQQKDRIEKTGIAKVLLYQSLLGFLISNKKSLKKYKYIVCDEAHFFTSDAMFNPETALILEAIIDNFQHSIRIYMSSTFNDCLECILDYEYNIHRLKNQNPLKIESHEDLSRYYAGLPLSSVEVVNYDFKVIYYQFERDYSYLDIKSYAEFSELFDIIMDSLLNNEKWLIFYDNITGCKKLKDELMEFINNEHSGLLDDNEVKVISAESKNDYEYMDSIIVEKFEEKILISTSVIDNGVNLKDVPLLNIVISDTGKVKCLQMIGRKRVEEDQIVNLYIKKFSQKHISDRIRYLEEQREAYWRYNIAYSSEPNPEVSKWDILNARRTFNNKYYNRSDSDFRNAKKWFYRIKDEPEYVKPNRIAVVLVDILISRYKYILDRIKETGDSSEFLDQQCRWFDASYDSDNDISINRSLSAREAFNEFIDSLPNRIIAKSDQDSFRREFYRLHKRAYGLRTKEKGYSADDNESRTEKYGRRTINDILKVRGINLEIITNKDGNWEIIEI